MGCTTSSPISKNLTQKRRPHPQKSILKRTSYQLSEQVEINKEANPKIKNSKKKEKILNKKSPLKGNSESHQSIENQSQKSEIKADEATPSSKRSNIAKSSKECKEARKPNDASKIELKINYVMNKPRKRRNRIMRSKSTKLNPEDTKSGVLNPQNKPVSKSPRNTELRGGQVLLGVPEPTNRAFVKSLTFTRHQYRIWSKSSGKGGGLSSGSLTPKTISVWARCKKNTEKKLPKVKGLGFKDYLSHYSGPRDQRPPTERFTFSESSPIDSIRPQLGCIQEEQESLKARINGQKKSMWMPKSPAVGAIKRFGDKLRKSRTYVQAADSPKERLMKTERSPFNSRSKESPAFVIRKGNTSRSCRYQSTRKSPSLRSKLQPSNFNKWRIERKRKVSQGKSKVVSQELPECSPMVKKNNLFLGEE